MEDMEGNFLIMGGKVVDGKLVSGKLVKIDRVENGVPVIKATETVETHHPDGRIDCTVKVPCFGVTKEE